MDLCGDIKKKVFKDIGLEFSAFQEALVGLIFPRERHMDEIDVSNKRAHEKLQEQIK